MRDRGVAKAHISDELIALRKRIEELEREQEELKTSNARLTEAQRIARMGNWHLDLTNNELWWSDELYSLFGTSRTAFRGTYEAFLNHLVHPEDRQLVKNFTTNALYSQGPSSIDHRIVLSDGSVRVFRQHARATYDVHGNLLNIGGTMQDITELKQMEESLHESEERYRDLFENANDLIQVINGDGRFLFVNKKWRASLKYTDDEVKKLTVTDIIRPDFLPHCMRLFNEMKEGKSFENVDVTFVAKDGTEIFLEGNISPYFRNNVFCSSRGIFRDVTDRKRVEARIRQQIVFLKTVIDSLPHPFYVIDSSTYEVKYSNKAAHNGDPSSGLPCYRMIHNRISPCSSGEHSCPMEELKSTGRHTIIERTYRDHNGRERNAELHCSPVFDEHGCLREIIKYSIDITEKKQVERQLLHLAYHDALTGVANRKLLLLHLNNAIALTKREGHSLAILFMDLDDFKDVNDSYGHDIGDSLLVEVVQRLRACVRESDTIARTGGDEFAIVLSKIWEPRDAAVVARKIIESLSQPFVIQGKKCFVGSSIGISVCPTDGTDLNTLLKRSDIAMYRAKEQCRNSYQFYSPLSEADDQFL